MPLWKHAKEMRDLYAAEIAAARAAGLEPSALQVSSFEKYAEAVRSGEPGAAFMPARMPAPLAHRRR
jgi:hypothetical protein